MLNRDNQPGPFFVGVDYFPNQKYVVRDVNGETVRCDKAPGWMRFSTENAALKIAARLNRERAK